MSRTHIGNSDMAFKMDEEQWRLFHELTPLHKLIATEILAGKTRAQAWHDARPTSKLKGQAATARVQNILKHPKVKAFMESMRRHAISNAIMSREEALERLSDIGRASLGDMCEFGKMQVGVDADGNPVHQTVWVIKDSVLQSKKALSTISELVASKDGPKIKQYSPLAAIERLAKIQGWDAPTKVDHTSSDGSMSPTPTIDASKLSTSALNELLAAYDEGRKLMEAEATDDDKAAEDE